MRLEILFLSIIFSLSIGYLVFSVWRLVDYILASALVMAG